MTRFVRANKAAAAKAREFGFKGLRDLDVNGTDKQKTAVKAIFENTK